MVQEFETPPRLTIGQRLLKARTERGLTRNLARHCIGYTFDTYDRTEDGTRLPMPVELAAIAFWLANGVERFVEELNDLRIQLDIERSARRSSPDAPSVLPSANGAQVEHAADVTPAVPA